MKQYGNDPWFVLAKIYCSVEHDGCQRALKRERKKRLNDIIFLLLVG
jgi:hypothetical protein